MKNLTTILDFLRYGMTQFNAADLTYGHGTDNAWDEVLALILHALCLPYDVDKSILNARLTENEKKTILQLFSKRIKERVPVPYLTNKAYFCGLEFYVDERVLIPRSPIAELIENEFSPWIDYENVHNILDLCTGSGCIAIACAYAFEQVMVDAVDISNFALEVANINIAKHQLQDRVKTIASDLFSELGTKKYDIIVTNPPYVETKDMAELKEEFLHEPELALAAGNDGLDIVRKILATANEHLTENGILICEVGNSQANVMQAFPELPLTWLEFTRGGEGVFLLGKQ